MSNVKGDRRPVSEFKLLKTPFFILKKMQRNALNNISTRLKGRILDVGCGQSPYRELLPVHYYIGMDKTAGSNVSVIGDALLLPFHNAAMDGVILTEVIEHVPVPGDLVKEITRVLNKNGLLYIAAPMTWGLHYEPNDYYRFTKYGIEYFLKQNGLSIVDISRIGGICSMISVRFIDVLYSMIQNSLFFLRQRSREKIGLIIVMPLSIIFYYASLVLDSVDTRDALGWAVLARKKRT